MSQGARVVEYELSLLADWLVIPSEIPDVPGWAALEADALIARSGRSVEPVDVSDVPFADRDGDGSTIDVSALLAHQLAAVVEAVRETRTAGTRTVVLARRPDLGTVDAMVNIALHHDIAPETFARELEDMVSQSEEQEYLFAQVVQGGVAAGYVQGAHLMIGHRDPTLGEAVAHLEERVALGVFPSGSSDRFEVTAIASSVGAFDDMATEIVDLIDGLNVTLGAAA